MRLRVKRTLIAFYLTLCALCSFVNYRYSLLSGEMRQLLVDQEPDVPVGTVVARSDVDDQRSKVNGSLTADAERRRRRKLDALRRQLNLGQRSGRMPAETAIDYDRKDDRILAQLRLRPRVDRTERKLTLYLPQGAGAWGVLRGDEELRRQNCPVGNCQLVDGPQSAETADVVLFRNYITILDGTRPPGQIWIYYTLESPDNTPVLSRAAGEVNWTATYRRDSDVVTPYEKFVPFDRPTESPLVRNYAQGKTKHVAWFASNCLTNNDRRGYALALAEHIPVDIYGSCGSLRCSRNDPSCFRRLDTDYRFYLAFENSNCHDYITEKFFVHGLQHDIIPVVMGAPKADYLRVAPPNSFIHVDDFDTPKDLAEYLRLLSGNETLYNAYFEWKGTGEFINTKFWCRLCAMLNAPETKIYPDLEGWWRPSGVCTNGRWANRTDLMQQRSENSD